MKGGLEVRALDNEDPLWDQIGSVEGLSVYHQKAWKDVVETTFGHTARYVVALEQGRPVDALPLFLVQLPFIGKKFVSTPYEACNGGIRSADGATVTAVIEKASNLARELGVKYLEIRSQRPMPLLSDLGFIEQNPFLICELTLTGIDENWKKLSRNHRRNVKIAKKKGVTIKTATHIDQMREFYSIVANHNRSMGLPFPARIYFDQIWEHLIRNDQAHLILATIKDEIVGGHLLFLSGKTLISKYAGYQKDARNKKLYASYALYWEGIRFGIEKGFEHFNMGITGALNVGLLDFKRRFGSDTSVTNFYYLPIRGEVPDFSKYYSEYRFIKKIWSLTPQILTAWGGTRSADGFAEGSNWQQPSADLCCRSLILSVTRVTSVFS